METPKIPIRFAPASGRYKVLPFIINDVNKDPLFIGREKKEITK